MSDLLVGRDQNGPRCFINMVPVHDGDGITIMVEDPDGVRSWVPGRFRWTFDPEDQPEFELFIVDPAYNDGRRVHFEIPRTAEVELIWRDDMSTRRLRKR